MELKAIHSAVDFYRFIKVPNLPCGVESSPSELSLESVSFVPNLPCGVESYLYSPTKRNKVQFLIYRVELKDLYIATPPIGFYVFLIYRVELKAVSLISNCFVLRGFLIYRVELKVDLYGRFFVLKYCS